MADVEADVKLLLEHLTRICGSKSETTFGEVFLDKQVEQTFESLVGTLKAAKTRGLVNFKGHMLLYPTNKDDVITLLPTSGASGGKPVGQSKKPAVKVGRTWTIPDEITQKRDEFEAARQKFEQKILEEWTEVELLFYHRAKLDAEIQFHRSAGGVFKTDEKNEPLFSGPEEEKQRKPTPQKQSVSTTTSPSVTASTPTPAGADQEDAIVKATRNIMNRVYKKMKSGFEANQSYDNEYILSIGKKTIVETTMELEGDPSMNKIKDIMNGVFKTLKGKFPAGTQHTGSDIMTVLKDTIVNTTNDLIQPAGTTNVTLTTNAATQPDSQPSAPEKTDTHKPKTVTSPTSSKPANNPSTKTGTASSGNSTSTAKAQQKPAVSKPVEQLPPQQTSGEDAPLSIEQTRKEAFERVNKHPKTKEVDLTDPQVLDTYVRMRGDTVSWMILGYKPENKDKLLVSACGTGGFDEFRENIPDDKPVYMYLNFKFGDTGRPRFIFMSYVPEFLGALDKARVVGHKGDTEKFVKYFQITWHMNSLDDLTEEELTKKLLKAGGANYSVQESNKGDFTSYKKKTKEFYSETDKKTEIKAVYSTGPLTTTPCDISGRPTVASTSEALKNTSDFFKGVR